MARYDDKYWWSGEGLRLHYRDYAADAAHADRPALLCLPGLTRNARDYARCAERAAGEWRVICPEMRGRGESAYAKDPMTYVPLTYVQDCDAPARRLARRSFVAIGTSLGGLLTMIMAATLATGSRGAVSTMSVPRSRSRAGAHPRIMSARREPPTWIHAARAVAETQARNYPDYTLEDWLGMAKRLYA
jgi:pimeloyl-ACP methyl ester carboxylesterase